MDTRTDICLRCPRGCPIETILGDDCEILKVSGNQCKLGIEYVKQEISDPRRILPTTVRVHNGKRPLVPVWTPAPIPKDLLMELAERSREIEVDAPVHVGNVVLSDWKGLGISLVASGEVEQKE